MGSYEPPRGAQSCTGGSGSTPQRLPSRSCSVAWASLFSPAGMAAHQSSRDPPVVCASTPCRAVWSRARPFWKCLVGWLQPRQARAGSRPWHPRTGPRRAPAPRGLGPGGAQARPNSATYSSLSSPFGLPGTQKTPLKSSNHQFKVCSAWALGPGPRCFGACVVLVLWWGGGARVARWRGGTVLGGSPNPLPRAFWAWTYVCPYTPGRSVA